MSKYPQHERAEELADEIRAEGRRLMTLNISGEVLLYQLYRTFKIDRQAYLKESSAIMREKSIEQEQKALEERRRADARTSPFSCQDEENWDYDRNHNQNPYL